MIEISVTTTNLPDVEEIRDKLSGSRWVGFVGSVGRNMVQQVRKNIRQLGGPGGEWPKLQGHGEGGIRNHTKRFVDKLKAEGLDKYDRAMFAQLRAAEKKRLKTEKDAGRISKHEGYAKRKELGKTPGHGKFSADVRLRDTGEMNDSLTAEMYVEGGTTVVGLSASGQLNQIKLKAHASGAGDLPVRNPANKENMNLFEKKTAEDHAAVFDKLTAK